jgi:hypothetical protein
MHLKMHWEVISHSQYQTHNQYSLIHMMKIIFTDNILLISTFTDPYEEGNIY